MIPRREDSRRWLALGAVCVGTLMIALDATVVNVALPIIQGDLHVSATSLAWVVNAYLVSFGGLLLLAGRPAGRLARPPRLLPDRPGRLHGSFADVRAGVAFVTSAGGASEPSRKCALAVAPEVRRPRMAIWSAAVW